MTVKDKIYVDSNGNRITVEETNYFIENKDDPRTFEIEPLVVVRLVDDPNRGYIAARQQGGRFGDERQPSSYAMPCISWFGEGERYPDAETALSSIGEMGKFDGLNGPTLTETKKEGVTINGEEIDTDALRAHLKNLPCLETTVQIPGRGDNGYADERYMHDSSVKLYLFEGFAPGQGQQTSLVVADDGEYLRLITAGSYPEAGGRADFFDEAAKRRYYAEAVKEAPAQSAANLAEAVGPEYYAKLHGNPTDASINPMDLTEARQQLIKKP